MSEEQTPMPLEIDHVRHEVSTLLAITESVLSKVRTNPEFAETLAKSGIEKLTTLLRYLDSHAEEGSAL